MLPSCVGVKCFGSVHMFIILSFSPKSGRYNVWKVGVNFSSHSFCQKKLGIIFLQESKLLMQDSGCGALLPCVIESAASDSHAQMLPLYDAWRSSSANPRNHLVMLIWCCIKANNNVIKLFPIPELARRSLHVTHVNIMKNDEFDSKMRFAKKGMSIAPLQNKGIIIYKSIVSRCEVRLYQAVSPLLQKSKLQLGIKI